MNTNRHGHPVQTGYAEVRVDGKKVFIQVSKDTGSTLTGFQVDKHGEKVDQTVRQGDVEMTTEYLFVVSRSSLVRRMVMNLHYAQLEAE